MCYKYRIDLTSSIVLSQEWYKFNVPFTKVDLMLNTIVKRNDIMTVRLSINSDFTAHNMVQKTAIIDIYP